MLTDRIVAQVKVIPMFLCRKCRRYGSGTTMRFEVDVQTAGDLKEAIDRKHAHANYMPVGWAAYGADGYECGTCNGRA